MTFRDEGEISYALGKQGGTRQFDVFFIEIRNVVEGLNQAISGSISQSCGILIEDRSPKNLTSMFKPLLNAPLPFCQEEARTILWRHRPVRGLVATGFSNLVMNTLW